MHSRQARRVFGGVIVVAVLAIGTLVATQWATNTLRKQVIALLGPTGHAAHIDVTLRQVVLDDVTIGGPPGWPAPQSLRAKRISLTLAPMALLHHQVLIRDAAFDTPYLSIVRGHDKRITLLPNLQVRQHNDGVSASGTPSGNPPRTASGTPGSVPPATVAPASRASTDAASTHYSVTLEKVTIRHGTLDFYDRRVTPQARIDTPADGDAGAPSRPYRLTFDNLQADIGPLQFPAGDARTMFSLSANARDADKAAGAADTAAPSGSAPMASPVHLDGWIVLATQQSDIRTRFQNVDVRTLTPYLDPHGTIAFEGGRAALNAHSTVENRQLHANGSLTLDHIQVARGRGPVSALERLSREAVIAALQDEKGQISLDFTLSGNLADPAFSLDETLSTRIIAGLAKVLGVNAEGVARSVGDTTKGLGEALRGLLGK